MENVENKKIIKIIKFTLVFLIILVALTHYKAREMDRQIKIIQEEKAKIELLKKDYKKLEEFIVLLGENYLEVIYNDDIKLIDKLVKIENIDKDFKHKILDSDLSSEVKDMFISTESASEMEKFLEMLKNMFYGNLYINECFKELEKTGKFNFSYINLSEKYMNKAIENYGYKKHKIQPIINEVFLLLNKMGNEFEINGSVTDETFKQFEFKVSELESTFENLKNDWFRKLNF